MMNAPEHYYFTCFYCSNFGFK